eukprot:Gb_16330 [translate_table: standard]
MSKCEFCKEEIEYLGHIVLAKGISVDPKKIKAVKEWKTLMSMHEVRSFLILASFYIRFVLSFSKLIAPLTELLKKSKRFKWTEQCQTSFDILKHKLTEALILTLPDVAKPFTLYIDASGVAIGVVLTKEGKVIAYESRKMNEAEMRYPICDQELLAIIHVIKIWKHYLKNNDFEVITGHKPLLSFPPKAELGSRQYRWAMISEEFKPKLTYQSGKENVVADALSRLPQAFNTLVIQGSFRQEIQKAQEQDEWCQESRKALEEGDQLRNISYRDELLWYRDRVVILDIAEVKYKILYEIHESPFASHIGRDKTYESTRKYVYWKNMQKEIAEYIQTCEQCQVNKADRDLPGGLLTPLPISEGKWKISMDFVTSLPKSSKHNDQIFAVVDCLMKTARFIPCKMTNKAKDIVKLLIAEVFTKFGIPKDMVSDRDSKFTSKVWTEVFNAMGTKMNFSSGDHPQIDG